MRWRIVMGVVAALSLCACTSEEGGDSTPTVGGGSGVAGGGSGGLGGGTPAGGGHGGPTDPQIQSTSDAALTHGESYTLSGSGFGQKNPVAPLRYFDFESCVIGERLPSQSDGGFQTVGADGVYPHCTRFPDGDPRLAGDDPNLVGQERIPGEVVVKQTYMLDEYGHYNQTIGLSEIDVSELYTSSWVYRYDVSGNATTSDNQKLWGNVGYSPPGEGYGQPQLRVDTYWVNGSGHIYSTDESGYANQGWGLGDTTFLGQWMRGERYVLQGTPSGDDGLSWVAANLGELGRIEGTLYTVGERYDYWVFSHFFRLNNSAVNPENPDPAELIQYVGEMYVDSTQARIEIGNAATWQSCSHREIQIPETIWDGVTIGFRANRGALPPGPAWLFVVGWDGNVSSGFEVVFN